MWQASIKTQIDANQRHSRDANQFMDGMQYETKIN